MHNDVNGPDGNGTSGEPTDSTQEAWLSDAAVLLLHFMCHLTPDELLLVVREPEEPQPPVTAPLHVRASRRHRPYRSGVLIGSGLRRR